MICLEGAPNSSRGCAWFEIAVAFLLALSRCGDPRNGNPEGRRSPVKLGDGLRVVVVERGSEVVIYRMRCLSRESVRNILVTFGSM